MEFGAESRSTTMSGDALGTPLNVGAEPAAALLSVQNLWKYYRDFAAVKDVSFTVAPGEIVGLIGPNGAGKTTVLRCIAGILRPTSGVIRCGGYSVTDQPQEAKRYLSLVPEMPNLYELLTVREHLRFVHLAFGETTPFGPRADELLRYLDLWEKRDALVATLSKGTKQKVAVACAFIHASNILLFDEPLIGIDPAGQRAIRELLISAAQNGAAVLVSSHILDTVEQLCHRVLILDHGRLIAAGSLDQLRAGADLGEGVSLEDVFLALTEKGEGAA
jgi:ABC-2 type transport system ATP-binding protein